MPYDGKKFPGPVLSYYYWGLRPDTGRPTLRVEFDVIDLEAVPEEDLRELLRVVMNRAQVLQLENLRLQEILSGK